MTESLPPIGVRLLSRFHADFVGRKMSPQLEAELKAMITEELILSERLGEIEDAAGVEVTFTRDLSSQSIHVEVLPRRPEVKKLPAKKPRGPSTQPDLDWEARLTRDELRWVWQELNRKSKEECCVDNFRAARIWVSSQRRRFRKIEARGCCGSLNWVERRWSIEKQRWDYYLLGFNYGH